MPGNHDFWKDFIDFLWGFYYSANNTNHLTLKWFTIIKGIIRTWCRIHSLTCVGKKEVSFCDTLQLLQWDFFFFVGWLWPGKRAGVSEIGMWYKIHKKAIKFFKEIFLSVFMFKTRRTPIQILVTYSDFTLFLSYHFKIILWWANFILQAVNNLPGYL